MEAVTKSSDEIKADRERRVFLEFVRKSDLAIDPGSVESREPPEPDIYCVLDGQGAAFELVEICNSELAMEVSRLKKRGGDGRFLMLDDPTPETYLKKIGKSYRSAHPVNILFYTDGLLVTPDDLIALKIEDMIQANGKGPFRRIWLLGQNVCCEIVP